MPYKSQGAIGDAERVLLANPYRVPLQALKIREAGKFCEKRYKDKFQILLNKMIERDLALCILECFSVHSFSSLFCMTVTVFSPWGKKVVCKKALIKG